MASLKDLSSVWNNIKEVDLKPIRDSATYPVKIVLAGRPGSGRHTLAELMRTDPARPGEHTQTGVTILSLENIAQTPVAHLIIMLVDAAQAEVSIEQELVQKWIEAGKNVLVLINKVDEHSSSTATENWPDWKTARTLTGSVNDSNFLQRDFVPTVLELLPQQHLALGRQFPLFRIPIAKQLISDTCFSNAAYSFSTGLAEIVPVLDLPLNLTDMIVLTKSQAFLAYKLGLLVGYSTQWQDYVKEFGGIIGGGFLWRQIARQLVGLIPVWGIIPKVVIAYSGTYVVGNAILGWYLTGRQLSRKQMRDLSRQALKRGKEYAYQLGAKLPRIRLRKRKPAELPEAQITLALDSAELPSGISEERDLTSFPGEVDDVDNSSSTLKEAIPDPIFGQGQGEENHSPVSDGNSMADTENAPEGAGNRICSQCGKTSASDASFCQYCGHPFKG